MKLLALILSMATLAFGAAAFGFASSDLFVPNLLAFEACMLVLALVLAIQHWRAEAARRAAALAITEPAFAAWFQFAVSEDDDDRRTQISARYHPVWVFLYFAAALLIGAGTAYGLAPGWRAPPAPAEADLALRHQILVLQVARGHRSLQLRSARPVPVRLISC